MAARRAPPVSTSAERTGRSSPVAATIAQKSVMLGVIALCMFVGCVLLFADLSDYPDSEAKGGPAITIPKVERGPATPPPAGNAAPATPPDGT